MFEELHDDMISDIELLLLSWAQMMAVEMIVADEETLAAKADITATLQTNFCITEIKLKQRDNEHYVISYSDKKEAKTISFDTDEVESIYDL